MTTSLHLTTDEALVLQHIHDSGEEDILGLMQSLQMSRRKVMTQLGQLKNKGLITVTALSGDWWVSISRRGYAMMRYLWPAPTRVY